MMSVSVDDENDDERSWGEALRNPLILQNIFKFLPTGFLLSSCSLVNKSWNNETRTFIRDYRKCTVGITGKTDETFCQFLKNLDEFVGKITENGRIVPFNSFNFNLTAGKVRPCTLDFRDDEQLAIPNLRSQLKLFHLDIDLLSFWYHCRVHKPLFLLLHHKGSQLQSLKIECASLLEGALGRADWAPDFRRLEFISVSNATLGGRESSWEQKLGIVRKIIKAAPNLQRIVTQDLETLRMVPQDKYKCLNGIEFKFAEPQDGFLYEKIVEAKPKLKKLVISPFLSDPLNHNNNNNARDRQLKFEMMLEKLLRMNHQTLETISISGSYEGFGRLSHPPLVNLSKFRMDRLLEVRNMSAFYNTISTIDYGSKMPRLEEVEFVAPWVGQRPGNRIGLNPTCSSSTTVRHLTLVITSHAANLSCFEPIFPNVSSLKIISSPLAGVMPFSKIWENWPRLEELEIGGERMVLLKSYDSEFCGIHPDEAELLREKDEEYFKTVNIVPIRHNLLNMKNLRKLRIDMKFLRGPSTGPHPSAAAGLNFISKVTEHVIFKKMPDVDISIRWNLRGYDRPEEEEEKYSLIQSPDTIRNELFKKVLEEPHLLRHVFTYIPTSLLLSSCSLVSKNWNTEARKFISENRKCTTKITDANSTCDLLPELDQLCCQIFNEGRVIPWNGIQVNFSTCNAAGAHMECPSCSADDKITLKSELKPKFLEFHWKFPWWGADCPVHKPLETLLRQCANGLRIFKIANLPPRFSHVLLSDCDLFFGKLEEIIISNLPCSDLRTDERAALNQIVKKIVESAPNLQKIVAKDTESLEIIPEDHYGLLHELKFHVRGIQDEILYVKAAYQRPALRKLRIFQPFPSQVNTDAPGINGQEAFNKSLEQLLDACHQTLEVISIESVYSLSELSFPALKSLKKLKLKTKFGPLQNFSRTATSIDYGQLMPNLEEVEIKMANLVEMDSTSREFFDGDVAWPCFDENRDGVEMLCYSNSVRKLTFELHVRKISFSVLKSLFPKVTTLEIRGNRSIRLKRDSLPLSEIFQFWPDLKKLRILGAKNFPNRHYDADLCGIHEDEAELLHKMNPDFLQHVHIVPIKPSLLSMTRLQKLWIESGIGDDLEPTQSDSSQYFVSTLAELIAFRRMPHLTVSFG